MVRRDVDRCAPWVDEHPMFAGYGMTSAKLEAALTAALERGDGLLVAEEEAPNGDGSLLGLAWFLTKGTFFHSGYLRLLLVTERAVGAGVGGRLMDRVEESVFGAPADLFLLVNIDNAGARRFYERRGYERVGRLDDYAAPGMHEYIYRKRRLASAPDGARATIPQ